MDKKIRLALFISFVILYLIFAPVIVFYSLGYRFDFERRELITTGAIYLQTWPEEVLISIGENIRQEANIFSNITLIQGLPPQMYSVKVTKEGYYSWEKTLDIINQEVIRVDNITLIKENIAFIKSEAKKLPEILDPDAPTETNRERAQTALPKLKGLLTYKISGNNIIWLSDEGLILKSDFNAKTVSIFNNEPILLKEKAEYEIITFNNIVFLKENTDLFFFNKETNLFEMIYGPVKEVKISPANNRLIYFNDYEILTANLAKPEKTSLVAKFDKKITDLSWFNSSYLIFVVGGEIKISEIDTRDKINIVSLPKHITFADETYLDLKNPKISWDYQTKKLSILEGKTIIESEPLTDRGNK